MSKVCEEAWQQLVDVNDVSGVGLCVQVTYAAAELNFLNFVHILLIV